jgi:ribosome-binding factor A
MSGKRVDRLNELIKRALCDVLRDEYQHSQLGWVTISRVVVSKDMQHARVFFTALGGADEEQRALQRLRHDQPRLRFRLAHSIHLRYTPELIFEVDDELKRALAVEELIERTIAKEQRDDAGDSSESG